MAVTAGEVIAGLERRGVPRMAAIGFAGNFNVESGLEPGINEINPVVPGSRGGYGLAQWTGPRRKQYETFAKSRGKPLDDLETQLDFTAWELANTEKKSADKIFAARTPEEAAELVSTQFLRPGIPHLNRRIASATRFAGGDYDVAESGGTMTDANTSEESLQSMAARLLQPVQKGSQTDTSVTDAFLSAGSMNVGDTAAQLLEGTVADPLQPRITEPVAAQPSDGRFQADIMRETAAPFADIARQAAAGVTGAGEGVADIPASIPLYGPDGPQIEIPEGVRNALNPILDAGIAALAGASTIPAGLAGIGGDVLEALGASPQSARRFAQDVAAMPEAFAGSPQQVIRSRVPSAPASRVDTPEAELIQTGAERGVRVLTSDVRQPKTWFGRWALASGEKIPVAGPGGQRAAQQQERLEAVRGLIREYSDDPNLSSDDLLALVADDIFTDQGQFVAKHAGMKQDVFENVKDAGPVPITNTEKRVNELIDQHVGKENRASKAIVDAATKWWYDLQRNGGIYDVERMRKLLGDEFSDLPGSEQQKAMNSLYGPLRADIEAFVLDKGGRSELNKLMVSNKKLSENMDEVKKTSLRTVLSKGDVSPEIVKNMLFSAKTSDVRNVFKKLSPEGKSNARAAILQDALERATNVDDISPKRFVSNLDKRARQIGVVFSEDDKRAIDGFMRLMKATQRADEASFVARSGEQLIPLALPAFLADTIGATQGGATISLIGLGGLARLYESPATRKLLVKMSRVDPGSKQEIELTQKLMTEMEKLLPSEAMTRGVQAATVATQGIENDE